MPPNSLEQEAMERVSRMYANYDRRPQSRQNQPRHAPQPPAPEPKPDPPKPSAPKKQNGLMELLMQDKDQSLILLLLVLLMKDGADLNLMLALVYLLL